MANKEIDELTEAGTLTGAELTHVVQSGNSRQTTLDDVADFVLFDNSVTNAKMADDAVNTDELVDGAVTVAKTTGLPFTEEFVSSEQTITAGGLLTLAHGLSAAPKLFQARLINKTTEGNWVADDEVLVNLAGNDPADTTNRGHAIYADATNVYVRLSSDSSTYTIANKTSGTFFPITNANWKLILRAWA